MKTIHCLFGCLSIGLLMTGCLPERVFWSPDGKTAAIVSGEYGNGRLYFCDAEGAYAETSVDGVAQVDWAPDGQHIIVALNRNLNDWKELDQQLFPFERQRVWELVDYIQSAEYTDQGLDQWIEEKTKDKQLGDNQLEIVAHFFRAHPEIAVPERIADAAKSAGTVEGMVLVKMAVNGMEIGATKILGFVTEPVWELRTSPSGDLALVVYGQLYTGDKLPAKIGVFPLAGNADRGCMISNNAAIYPDWTRDGRSVVYAEGSVVTEANNDNSLGKIRRATLVDEAGKVMWDQLALQDLADILMNTQTCIRALTNGNILFSSPEATLPSGVNDHIRQVGLYSLDPQNRSTPARMIPHSEILNMGGYLWAFEVSPDENRIAFVTEGGRIAFMDLASGSVHFIQNEARENEQICTLPSWRSPDDICFCRPLEEPAANGAKAELVLYRNGEYISLSKDWPESMIKGFLN